MRTIKRLFALCLSCLTLATSSHALSTNETAETHNALISGLSVLEEINVEEQKSEIHISRWNAVEPDLRTLVFENSDATVTSYFFAEPVKYIDQNGNIRDKSNDLTMLTVSRSNPYAFVNASNDINTYFPQKLDAQTAILLTDGTHEIEMYPQSNASEPVTARGETDGDASNHSVYYDGVFGPTTALRYSATFSGFKEDIIMKQKGENSFAFTIKTNGLSAEGTSNMVVFRDNSGNIVADIGGLYAYDSSTNPLCTDNIVLQLITKIENEEYTLIMSVDEEYISNPNTVYPVFVDPTITIRPAGAGATKTVQDASVFIGTPSNNYGGEQYIYVGNTDNLVANRRVGRTLMKFPSFIAQLSDIDASRIVSAQLHLYESSGKSTNATVVCRLYTGTDWNENSVCANNMTWAGTGSTLYSQSFSGTNKWVPIDLRGAIAPWKNSASSANKGILLQNGNETTATQCLRFNSTENSQNKPYITVTWGKFTVNHYLDQGYRTRFSSASTAVTGHQSVVSSIFKELFGLTVVSNVTSTTSLADDCRISALGSVTASNLATACSHSPDHLTTARLRSDLVSNYGSGTNTLTRVLWTGHILTGNPSSNSVSANHTVIMTSKEVTSGANFSNKSTQNVNIESRFDLLHELSHQLGAPDHYCYGDQEASGHCSNTNCRTCNGLPQLTCVMTSRKNIESINTSSLYCSACRSTIQNHVNGHH